MSFEPKQFQKDALEALSNYLDQAQLHGSKEGFYAAVKAHALLGRQRYEEFQGLEGIPQVCLRLPTGGGKTYLAARSIAVARKYLNRDYPLVVWMVPTSAIRDQTLATLKPGHPNWEALHAAFGERIRVLDVSDFTQLRPQDLRDKVCIIIGTFAVARVGETELRKVYAHHEELEPHFASIPPNAPGLECNKDGPDAGKVKMSFANLLAWERPLVIVDEAHNMRSTLSTDVLVRIKPACILEFTATPAKDSNLICHVTAAELKKEAMIKLPIILTERTNWQEAIHDALLTRKRLDELAVNEKDFVRPIVLIQADDADKPVNVATVEKYLVEVEKIERTKIAIATGSQRELKDVDLMKPGCPVEVVVTVEALKEGWDCPFAYVFCSVAVVHSPKDVEQLLGRVLRMPYATERTQPELSRAYAFVSDAAWPQAVSQLQDRLVAMGFDPVEAAHFVGTLELPLTTGYGEGLKHPVCLVQGEAPPMFFGVPDEDLKHITLTTTAGGYHVAVNAPLTERGALALLQSLPVESRPEMATVLARHQQQPVVIPSPHPAKPFIIPRLCVLINGELCLADTEAFIPMAGVDLLGIPGAAELSEPEFSVHETADCFEIDMQGQRLTIRHLGAQMALNLGEVTTTWTDLQLSREIAADLRPENIRPPIVLEFIRRVIVHLNTRRNIPLGTLIRLRYPLQKAILDKIDRCRSRVLAAGYQQLLFAPTASIETSFTFAFTLDPEKYAPPGYYHGGYQFAKHFCPGMIGAFDTDEEEGCAQNLDRHPRVVRWARNISRGDGAFSLPLSERNFYPDFIAELDDGRLLVVEYKGAHLIEGAQEKKNIGEKWAEGSKGRGLFLMAVAKDDYGRDVARQLADVIGTNT